MLPSQALLQLIEQAKQYNWTVTPLGCDPEEHGSNRRFFIRVTLADGRREKLHYVPKTQQFVWSNRKVQGARMILAVIARARISPSREERPQ